MKRSGTASAATFSTRYLRRTLQGLAAPATRSVSDPLAEWAVQRIRLEGRPFRFEGHEYLRAIYDDVSPHVVLSKAAQVGGTVWALLRSIHACLSGLSVLYLFPTRSDVIDFSKSRVGPLLADNAFLARMMSDTDTAGLKRIGEAFLYLRGMQSTVGLKSVPADMLVFDELDEAPPNAKAMAMERLAHSDYKRIVELSNPSLPDYGIDEMFVKSDQRHWTLKCPACGRWTAPVKAFPTKLGEQVEIIRPREDGSHYLACPECEAELDLAAGEWVADFPDRSIHGYRISQLFSSKVDPGEILTEYRTTRFPDRFFNLKIGIPWADLERRLDAATVLALCGDDLMLEKAESGSFAMGVDTGKLLHVVILQNTRRDEPHRLVHLAVCRDFEELDSLMKTFRVSRCVIDGLPETHATRAFANRHGSRVFLCFFNETQRGTPKWNEDEHIVQINRTEALDASRAAVREKKLVLPRQAPLVEKFAHHMASDAKVLDEDEATGIKKYRYIKTGENHFSLACTYALLAGKDLPGPINPDHCLTWSPSIWADDRTLWECVSEEDQQPIWRTRFLSSSSDGWV
ncbi:phage terminase large subunit family protein [Candidatus Eisenbacteria bacterium]|uniref:Phage terminase large subunit family protein n=1 Tax=Eiseniibacteriota bacterium TaxID=2212470 RepID=A0ABV6YLL4_UNCEI